MKYLNEECIELLKKSQNGDKFATDDLLGIIQVTIMPRRIGRYLYKNRQVENEDLKQEFMIGVFNAIAKADLNVGDPIEFLVQHGVWAVKSYMRKFITQSTRQICLDCGNKSRIHKNSDGQYECRKCHSNNISVDEVNDNNEVVLNSIPSNRFEDDLLSELEVQDFKSTLTEGTNVYCLYELLVEQGIDRDNPLVKNYVKEIANTWGTSNQNVIQNLNKLKDKINKYYGINQINLVGI